MRLSDGYTVRQDGRHWTSTYLESRSEALQRMFLSLQTEVFSTRIHVNCFYRGGNLAVVTSLKASLLPEPIQIIFQVLIVPVIDNTATVKTIWSSRAKAPWLTPARMLWYRKMYLPDINMASNWDASPNLAPESLLARMPRTWIAVADQDVLAPEALSFADQLGPLGVDVEVAIYGGMTHTILAMNGKPYFSMSRQVG